MAARLVSRIDRGSLRFSLFEQAVQKDSYATGDSEPSDERAEDERRQNAGAGHDHPGAHLGAAVARRKCGAGAILLSDDSLGDFRADPEAGEVLFNGGRGLAFPE